MSTKSFDYPLYESHFSYRQIAPNTWCFNTCHPSTPASSDAYLVIGDDRAIMIDCGMSRLNLKTYIDQLELTTRPIIGVIDTHSHFDHTACNGYFGHAFMHPNAEAGAKSASPETLALYPMDYTISYLHEGDTIDLGGRVLEIFEIPAHDAGSIAILDQKERLLFTGDEIESGWVKCNLRGTDRVPGDSLKAHITNMERLKAMWDKYDFLCPAHHGNPISKETIDQFLVCGKLLLDKITCEYSEVREEHYEAMHLPIKQRPQVLCRFKSAHMGYFLTYVRP